jgi:DNA helicase II / ATP-dependent DNA helicase PcrA
VYVPARYYHRPQGRDDAHSMGRASRFLTKTVQRLFNITGSPDTHTVPSASPIADHRIEVSVDGLFA